MHRRAEFLAAQQGGARFQTKHFVVYANVTGGSRTRLGLSVSRRIGGAVVRNRVKRRVRECFRLKLRPMLPKGTDLVVIARSGAGELTSQSILSELTDAALDAKKWSHAYTIQP